MTHLILFDFDGMLADNVDDMLRFAAQAGTQIGLSLNPTPADLEALEMMDLPSYGRQLGVPEEMRQQFADHVRALFLAKTEPPNIFPGMRDVLLSLEGRSVVAVITGNSIGLVQKFLSRHGLEECVSLIFGGETPGTRLHKALRALRDAGVTSENACIVSDAVSDIYLAREIGITSIAVTWGYQSQAKLASAHPDHIVDTPQELQAILHAA
jgi:phosphoglycolate phosphatase-like HAD superfamily hydrolase